MEALTATAKRTYSLPLATLRKLEGQVKPGERSAFLASLIEEWHAAKERDELRRQVIEGCLDMADVYAEMEREWAPLSDEVWRAEESSERQ